MNYLRILLVVTVFLLSGAMAHEGEDHSASTDPMFSDVAPRAHAASEDLELVAVRHEERLIVYLDTYATNEPIENAAIELETGAFKAAGKHIRDGVYEFAVSETFAAPGKYALLFTVQVGEVADLLNTTFEIPDAAITGGYGGMWSGKATWIVLSVILVFGVAWFGWRRLRRMKNGETAHA